MTIRLDPALEGSLASRAHGRLVVVDVFRSRCCGSATWVGDITARFADGPPGPGFVTADPIEGVPVVVRASLTRLLDLAGASLEPSGLLRRDSLRVGLDRPELWLDWLARPSA